MFCKVCEKAHYTYKCPTIQSLVEDVKNKTLTRRANMLNFICKNGLHNGRIFETESVLFPQEVFGDAVKLNIFWEPREFSAFKYIEDKYVFTNYRRDLEPNKVFDLNPTVFQNNFCIRAVPTNMFLRIDKEKISGILEKRGSLTVTGFGFMPFGRVLHKEYKKFLFYIDIVDFLKKTYLVDELPIYFDFDFDFWNFASLEQDDWLKFNQELRLYYNLVANKEIKKIYKSFGLDENISGVGLYSFDMNNYCSFSFQESNFISEVQPQWTKKDTNKVVQRVVKVFY